MPYVLCRHRVEDYARWRPYFDGPDAILHTSGATKGHVFRSFEDPNEIFILLEWDTIENLRKFMDSPELRDAMRDSGVVGEPEFHIVEELEPPRIRMRTEEPRAIPKAA